jgi:Fe2+ or Zn2+ uptake regulation protein
MGSISPDFRNILHERGFRQTPGRVRLLEILWSAKRPLTVEEIARRVDLNVVTLYRALNELARTGLIARGIGASGITGDITGDIRAAHFSYAREDHHHHLVCMDCGFVKTCTTCK